MSKASDLRAFAISVEAVIRMLPKFVRDGSLRRSEADHLTQQLRRGVENALNVVVDLEAAPTIQPAGHEPLPLDTVELISATKALLPVLIALRHTVGLGKTQMDRIERAQRAVHAAESAAAAGALPTSQTQPAPQRQG